MTSPFTTRCARVMHQAEALGAAALVVSEPGSLRWLTGLTVDVEWGMPAWSVGTHLLLTRDRSIIICPDGDEELSNIDGFHLARYAGLTLSPELEPGASAAAALCRALSDLQIPSSATIGVESALLPAVLSAALSAHTIIDVQSMLQGIRATKDASDIDLVKQAGILTDVGQGVFRDILEPGISEVELWSTIHGAMEQVAGGRVPVLADLVSGPRTRLGGGQPSERRVGPGELVLCDLAPRRDGYWADSCVTICAGVPTAEMQRLHDTARRALEAGVRHTRPGITAGSLDTSVRTVMDEAGYTYSHHSGHGVGTDQHGLPRIVPGSSVLLEENMVIALEPGAYNHDMGLRVEYVLVVREGGSEVLSHYALDLV